MLSLYENDKKDLNVGHRSIIKELDEYILKTKNPIRAVQACKAKWLLAYNTDSKDSPSQYFESLLHLINSVRKDHEKGRFSIFGTASDLAKILIRAQKTIVPILHPYRAAYPT